MTNIHTSFLNQKVIKLNFVMVRQIKKMFNKEDLFFDVMSDNSSSISFLSFILHIFVYPFIIINFFTAPFASHKITNITRYTSNHDFPYFNATTQKVRRLRQHRKPKKLARACKTPPTGIIT